MALFFNEPIPPMRMIDVPCLYLVFPFNNLVFLLPAD